MTGAMDFSKWGINLAEMRSDRWPNAQRDAPTLEETWYRAVSINAPVQTVFRWICQLRAAPYSYDWIDNVGKPSPRYLIEGLDQLRVGQKVMRIFRVHEFSNDSFMTIVPWPPAKLFCSDLRITYRCAPADTDQTRLLVRVQICYPKHPFRPIIRLLLPAGDLIMMRKQLFTLKQLCEQ